MSLLCKHPIVTSLVITPVLLAAAAVTGGVGHGNYALGILLFPFAAITAVLLDRLFESTIIMILVAAIQFPLYGVWLSICRWRKITALLLLLVWHLAAAAVAFWVVYPEAHHDGMDRLTRLKDAKGARRPSPIITTPTTMRARSFRTSIRVARTFRIRTRSTACLTRVSRRQAMNPTPTLRLGNLKTKPARRSSRARFQRFSQPIN